MGLIYGIIHWIIQVLILVMVIQAILSFFMDPYHPVRRTIDQDRQPFPGPYPAGYPPDAEFGFQSYGFDYFVLGVRLAVAKGCYYP